MKWLLCLALIGLGLYSFNQTQTIDKLNADLKTANADVADLKTQLQNTQVRVATASRAAVPQPLPQSAPLGATPAPSGNWMWGHSTLDPNSPKPGRR